MATFILRRWAKGAARDRQRHAVDQHRGPEITSDERRGKKEVFNKNLRGWKTACAGASSLWATSVCQSNIEELLTEQWVQDN